MEPFQLPPWAAIKTTTIQTTITIASGQQSVTLFYPWPARTAPIEYVTVTRTASVIPKQEVNQPATYSPQLLTTTLPVLVLTNVEAAIVNMEGKTIKRETLTQPSPFYIGTTPLVVPKATPGPSDASPTEDCTQGFKCWNKAEQIGTLVAVAIVGSGIIWLIISILWRCWLPTNIHAGQKNQGGALEDVERGGVAVVDPTLCATIVPVGTDGGSNESGETDAKQIIGSLWLWRKRHLLRSRKVLRKANDLPIEPSVIAAAPPTPHRRKNPQGISLPTISSSIKARDFAYEVGETGSVHVLSTPTAAVPTVDADEKEKADIRAARALRREQSSISNALAAAEAERTKQQELQNYRTGQRNRRRGEASRSEASENYEKRGDRLRKESPDGKLWELEEKPDGLGKRTSIAQGKEKSPNKAHNAMNFGETRGRSTIRRLNDEEGNDKRRQRSRIQYDRYNSTPNLDTLGDERRQRYKSFERFPPTHYDPRENASGYERERGPESSKTKSALQHDHPFIHGHSSSHKRRKKSPEITSKRQSRLWTLLPLALQAINTLAEPDGGWERYQKNRTERHRSTSAKRGSPGNSRRTRPGAQVRRLSISDEEYSPKTRRLQNYAGNADNLAFSVENNRRTSHRRKKEANISTSEKHDFTTNSRKAEIHDNEQENPKLSPRRDKLTEHSPLRDVSGPPPPMDAPTPSRRLSRKHVRLVDRDTNEAGFKKHNLTCKVLEGEDAGKRDRKNSVQSRDGGDSMAETEWEEIVSGLSKE